MQPTLPRTTEEISAILAGGPAAALTLVQHLLAQIDTQQLTIEQLSQRVADLEERLGRNSRNSNQPPASDGFNRPPRSQRPSRGKRPGGQPGHKGSTLRFNPLPDHIILHRPPHCTHCGHALADVAPDAPPERRQVVDLPPLRLETTEHQLARITCPQCTHHNQARGPGTALEPLQYGPRLKALGLYLTNYQLLPYERTTELLTDLFGAAPSAATLYGALEAAAAVLEPVEQVVRESLQQAPVAHFDETGFHVRGKRQWLHVASTATLTLYFPALQRGQAASQVMDVLPHFTGVAVHDCYSSYFVYPCRHALCNAHLLRELTAVEERGGQAWASKLKELLREGKTTAAVALARGQRGLDAAQVRAFQQKYRELLREGLALNPANPAPAEPQRGRVKQSKAYNLLVRLREQEDAVMRFLNDLRVPFDNNQAERDLRMMKVQQKISGCFRSQAGAAAFCRVRGYISTLRKQDRHVLTALEQVFNGGTLVLPATS
jgi:transposase